MVHLRDLTGLSGSENQPTDITRFVNARLNRQRDERGYMIPRTEGVSITTAGVCWFDADVRAIDESGITLSVLGGISKHVPWAEVRHITVERLDA